MSRQRKPPTMDVGPLGVGLPLTEARILMAANWVRDTTLLYGGSISTAFTVAGIFAHGLEQEMAKSPAQGGEARQMREGEG